MHKGPSLVVAIGLVGATIVSGVALTAPIGFAVTNGAEAQASVVVSASCSMTATVDTAHTAILINGQYSGDNGSYSSGIGQTTISTACNDPSGYAIYAIGYTNNTEGSNVLANSAISGYDIASGTATSGNTSNWAMKVSPVANGGSFVPTITNDFKDGSGNPIFSTVPSSQYTKVAYLSGNTGEASQASSVTATYAAYISPTQPAGTYTGQVAYLLVHPANLVIGTYSIAYNAAGGSGTMNTETVKNYEPHTLATNTFTAPAGGYTFKGWCTVQDTNATPSSPQTTCGGTSYDPGATIPVGSEAANSILNLYAVWRAPMTFNEAYAEADKEPYNYNDTNYYTMQDMTPDICGSVAIGQTTTLIDTRGTDKQTYTVAKLKDGKCWMTENLNIAGGIALSSNDTDFESTYTLPTTNGWSVSNGKLVLPSSSTAFGTADNVAKLYNSGNKTNCGALNQNVQCYSYYSWDAATLGSGRSISTDNTDAPYSICPKNWKLPTAYTTDKTNWQTLSDFYVLAHQYGLDSNTSTTDSDADFYNQAGPGTTPNFLLAGLYYNSSFYYGGSYGYSWSSTSSSGTSARNLYFNSSLVYSANSNDRWFGLSVRCLAAPSS